MDQDELSKDDLIGGTQISLYEILHAASRELCIKRLLDDRSVRSTSCLHPVSKGGSLAPKPMAMHVLTSIYVHSLCPKHVCTFPHVHATPEHILMPTPYYGQLKVSLHTPCMPSSSNKAECYV